MSNRSNQDPQFVGTFYITDDASVWINGDQHGDDVPWHASPVGLRNIDVPGYSD